MTFECDLPVTVVRDGTKSVRDQILDQLKHTIATAIIAPNDPMPSTRSLATKLGVARSTVVDCYLELEGEGWLYSRHGSGTYVAPRVGERNASTRTDWDGSSPTPSDVSTAANLMPGTVDPSLIHSIGLGSAWRDTCWSGTLPPAAGIPELRVALAHYLTSSRGLDCCPDEIFLCAGTGEAMLLLGLALGWSGRNVGVEEPGYPAIRNVLRRLGAHVNLVSVLDPEALIPTLQTYAQHLSALYLTPSHQYPLGHRIKESDRNSLLEWAEQTGTVLVEDDYDSEFRFGVPPLPSLAGLDPNSNTAYIGTMSKILDPALRIAYLRVPPHLAGALKATREDLGSTTSAAAQHAVARLLRSGELAKHIARARRLYSDRRAVAIRMLKSFPAVRSVRGLEAGLHVVVELEAHVHAAVVVSQAHARGVLVADLDDFRSKPDLLNPALVIGYGSLAPQALRSALSTLGAIPELSHGCSL